VTDPTEWVMDNLDHVRHPPGPFAGGFGVSLGSNSVCLAPGAVEMPGALEPCPEGRIPFQIVEFTRGGAMTATTGEDARLWIMVGGHSGFEGFSAIYCTAVELTLEADQSEQIDRKDVLGGRSV
jgi:hypothetical protein